MNFRVSKNLNESKSKGLRLGLSFRPILLFVYSYCSSIIKFIESIENEEKECRTRKVNYAVHKKKIKQREQHEGHYLLFFADSFPLGKEKRKSASNMNSIHMRRKKRHQTPFLVFFFLFCSLFCLSHGELLLTTEYPKRNVFFTFFFSSHSSCNDILFRNSHANFTSDFIHARVLFSVVSSFYILI